MSTIDQNSPAFQEAKKRAIAFYDNEHNLGYHERMDLYVFYEELWRRTLLFASMGFATGVTLPFILKKKNKLLNPLFPIVGGFFGLSTVPALMAPLLYNKSMKKIHKKYTQDSKVNKVLEVTPDPFTKSWFWSNYFKQSASDPTKRIRDPRNPNAMLPETHRPKNGIQGFGEYNRSTPENPELTSAWDKIRHEQQTELKSGNGTNELASEYSEHSMNEDSNSNSDEQSRFSSDSSSYYGYAAPSNDPQSPSYNSVQSDNYPLLSSRDSYLSNNSNSNGNIEKSQKQHRTSEDSQSYNSSLSGAGGSETKSAWDVIREQNGEKKD